MKVFLTSAYPFDKYVNYTPVYLKESQMLDPFKVHQITEDPEEADIIIFAEHHQESDPYFFTLYKNEIYRKYKRKCYLYHNDYTSITFVPTISATLRSKYYDKIFNQPFGYLIQLVRNKYIDTLTPPMSKKYLFSFIGQGSAHPVRKKIFDIKYEKCFLSDTSGKVAWELHEKDKAEYAKRYVEICFDSKFMLCPRGASPNSYRLYESLEMGVAPVIISDEWVPTVGPKWEEFSIRISEKDIGKIPQILEKFEPGYVKMGKLAKEAYFDWFAKDKQFHYLIEAFINLHNARDKINFFVYLKQSMQFLEPFNARGLLRYFKNSMIKK
jgi:glycosyltransferase involved in cell wall biosynthesis